MSNQYYEAYLDDVYKLARSLVVKSEATAEAINKEILIFHPTTYISEDNKTEWKYYMNLAGEYHFSNEAMTIISIDDNTEIPFTKESLYGSESNPEGNPATLEAYWIGSPYYKDLVNRFPHQETLIKGIINPVDINKAIAAEDNAILFYDVNLVDENEISLIPKLQEWINRFFYRWNVPAFGLIEELYTAAHLGIFWSAIPMVIINLRLAACRTHEAHSYHIKQFLASHGGLDVYMDYMNKKQQLFLYRNLPYLERNAGKQEILELLVKRILTDRGIPLNAWNLSHNVEHLGEKIYPDDEDSTEVYLYPEAEMIFESMNNKTSSLYKRVKTVHEILVQENELAKDNPVVIEEAESDVTKRFTSGKYGTVNTKVLESSMIDYSDAEPYRLIDVLLNHWIHWAGTDKYLAYITFKHPITLLDINMSVKDSLRLFFYAVNKSFGITLTTMPVIVANRVRKLTLPTRNNLLSLVDDRIDPIYADYVLRIAESKNLSNLYQGQLPPINPKFLIESDYSSILGFYNACENIYKRILLHRDLYAYREFYYERGQIERMVEEVYEDVTVDLGSDINYEDWFTAAELDLTQLSPDQWKLLAIAILHTSVGYNLKKRTSLKDTQRALLSVVEKLSSYSIQFLQTINSGSLNILEWTMPRIGPMDYKTKHKFQFDVPDMVDGLMVKAYEKYLLDVVYLGSDIDVKTFGRELFEADPTIDVNLKEKSGYHYTMSMPPIRVDDFTMTEIPPGP